MVYWLSQSHLKLYPFPLSQQEPLSPTAVQVINNMVGFTTDPRAARSSYHCTLTPFFFWDHE